MKTKKKSLGVTILPYALIAPTLLSICIFSFYPFIKTIISSFSFTDEYGNTADAHRFTVPPHAAIIRVRKEES